MTPALQAAAFIVQVILLYFFGHWSLDSLFFLFSRIVRHKKVVFSLLSILFLPGTILHETAHFLTATAVFLKVTDFTVIPQFDHHSIRLGRVQYIKKDVFRSIIVGVAPIFFGLGFFAVLSFGHLFPQSNIILNIILGYLIFSVSSTMFSSKQDLVDIVYLLPVILILAAVCYIFNINVWSYVVGDNAVAMAVQQFLDAVNLYLFFSLVIHICITVIIRWLFRIR